MLRLLTRVIFMKNKHALLICAMGSCFGLIAGYFVAFNLHFSPLEQRLSSSPMSFTRAEGIQISPKPNSDALPEAKVNISIDDDYNAIIQKAVDDAVKKKLSPLRTLLQQQQTKIDHVDNLLDKSAYLANGYNSQSAPSEQEIIAIQQQESLQAAQDFDDDLLLFELENHNKSASAHLSVVTNSLENYAEQLTITGLTVNDSECRGELCRVQLRYEGNDSALQYIPALVATEGYSQMSYAVERIDQGSLITVLLK